MRRHRFAPLILAMSGMLLPQLAMAADAADSRTVAAAKPVYVPPNRGAPASRVGGATRGAGDEQIIVRVLAPEQPGLAATEQPVLYWYVSGPAATRVEVALIDDAGEAPLLELGMDADASGGIRSLRLADHGIRLQPNVEYQWSVALVVDPNRRSLDVLASGSIVYSQPDAALSASLAAASPAERPAIYAASGYWYDAIDMLCALIDAGAGNTELAAHRAALLEQVGLSDVVAGAGD
jgi:hypothetical protein